MSELPPRPPRLPFSGSKSDRYVMDWFRIMRGTRQQVVALRVVNCMIKSEVSLEEAHEILAVLIGLAHSSARREMTGVPTPPTPSREALMNAEISRRATVMKGGPKFTLINGDKE